MKEINFYCIEEDVNLFLYTFLSKLVEKGNKIIIFSENEEKRKKLDETLWNIKKTGFLPHCLYEEDMAKDTPLLLSNKKENKYNSNFLLISNFVEDIDFLNTFEKIFYIFMPINQTLIKEAEKNWNYYKNQGFELKLFRKNKENKWFESNNFNVKLTELF